MISYGKQWIDQTDIDAVVETLKSDWLTQGPVVEQFEEAVRARLGAGYACAVANGTAALHLTGLALDWGPGDIVITSPITFLASANCIVYAGATPDFVDIDPVTYTIDTNKLEEKIRAYQSKGKKVKAIIGVDYAGHPCDWKALRTIADQYELQLVNDNCHALGASYIGDTQYAVKYADVVTQSYHPVKHITTGEGGAVFTNDAKIDEKVRTLRSHGMTNNPERLDKDDGPWYYEMQDLGYNYRITDFQCALGISQLRKLEDYVIRRREIANSYDQAFDENDLLLTPKVTADIQHSYHLYPLQIEFEKAEIDKKTLFAELKNSGINLQVHYIPVHTQPYYRRNYGFNFGDFPNAENFYQNELSLPIYHALEEEDIQLVQSTIQKLLV